MSSGQDQRRDSNEALEKQFSALPGQLPDADATTDREQSFEDPKLSTGYGFFTYYLVRLSGYADNDPCDGRITADELIEYVRTNVRRYARERQLSQTPLPAATTSQRCCWAWRRVRGRTARKGPSMLGTAVIETNMDDVDVYIDGHMIGRSTRTGRWWCQACRVGLHEFQGVKAGYEPDRKEVMIAPG